MDRLVRFLFDAYRVRGQIVRLEGAWAEVARRQRRQGARDLPPNVTQRLGELSVAGLLLSSSLKFEGSVILQIQGPGPVSLFVVEAESNNTYRATLKVREGEPLYQDASLKDLVGGDQGARFAVTLVPGSPGEKRLQRSGERRFPTSPASPLRQPYQGIVPFEGDTVAEILEGYMARSEQIPTRLWLAADDRAAFGMILQRIPDQSIRDRDGAAERERAARHDEGWNRVTTLADTLTRHEMLDTDIETLLRRLFWECPIALLGQSSPAFECSCSRDKVGSMLKMLGRDEVDAVLREQQQVSVKCEFCYEEYAFSAQDCAALFNGDARD